MNVFAEGASGSSSSSIKVRKATDAREKVRIIADYYRVTETWRCYTQSNTKIFVTPSQTPTNPISPFQQLSHPSLPSDSI